MGQLDEPAEKKKPLDPVTDGAASPKADLPDNAVNQALNLLQSESGKSLFKSATSPTSDSGCINMMPDGRAPDGKVQDGKNLSDGKKGSTISGGKNLDKEFAGGTKLPGVDIGTLNQCSDKVEIGPDGKIKKPESPHTQCSDRIEVGPDGKIKKPESTITQCADRIEIKPDVWKKLEEGAKQHPESGKFTGSEAAEMLKKLLKERQKDH